MSSEWVMGLGGKEQLTTKNRAEMLHLLVSLLDALGISAKQTWQSQALLITVIIMIMEGITIVINNYHYSTSQDGLSYSAVTNTSEISMA